MEWVPYGDLHAYLRKLRQQYEAAVAAIAREDEEATEADYVGLCPDRPKKLQDLMTASVHSTVSSRGSHPPPCPSPSAVSVPLRRVVDVFLDTSEAVASIQFADDDAAVPDLSYSLDPDELQSFAAQIASGMVIPTRLPPSALSATHGEE